VCVARPVGSASHALECNGAERQCQSIACHARRKEEELLAAEKAARMARERHKIEARQQQVRNAAGQTASAQGCSVSSPYPRPCLWL